MFCSGVDKKVLNLCKSEENKFISIGLSVLLTSLLASISGGYSVYFTFNNIVPSMLFGILWGTIIFNLDRYIISSTYGVSGVRSLIIVIPRLIISVLLAITISKPLELKLFEVSINEVIQGNYENDIAKKEDRFNSNKRDILNLIKAEEIKEKDDKILRDLNKDKETAVNSNLVLMRKLQKDTTGLIKKLMADGRHALNKINKDISIRNMELAKITRQSEAHSMDRIRGFQKQLALMDSELGVKKENGADILIRLKALSELKDSDLTMSIASFFITMLFIMVEVSPVLIKLFTDSDVYNQCLKSYMIEQKKIENGINDNNVKKLRYKLIIELKTNQTSIDYLEKKRLYLRKVKIDKWYDSQLTKINSKA